MEPKTKVFVFTIERNELVEQTEQKTIDEIRKLGWYPVSFEQVGSPERYQVVMENGYSRR